MDGVGARRRGGSVLLGKSRLYRDGSKAVAGANPAEAQRLLDVSLRILRSAERNLAEPICPCAFAIPKGGSGEYRSSRAFSAIHPHGEPTAHEILEARRLAALGLAYRPDVDRLALSGLQSEASDFALARFEDLSAAVKESRVSFGFVNGPCSDRRLSSTLLPNKDVIP